MNNQPGVHLSYAANLSGNVPSAVESDERFRHRFYATCWALSSVFWLTMASRAAIS